MDVYASSDWDEAWEYQPGFTVELRSKPGAFYTVESYDPMMVPSVWLVDDPRPRYPHELKLISRSSQYVCPLPTPIATKPQLCSL
ncbi:MAG: hypothetical protein IGS38_21400 [Synechococcales cyanobacterium M58_A2018_015]|nr:hypothetical protein [Synechococcales cyanobacterium M58_A2018_015]